MKIVTLLMIAATLMSAGCGRKGSKAPEIGRRVVERTVVPDTPVIAPEPPLANVVVKSFTMLGWGNSSPVLLDGDTVVLGGGNSVYFVNTVKGEQEGVFLTEGQVLARPAVTADGKVVAVSFDGMIYILNSVGLLLAKYKTEGAILASPAVMADGTIVVASLDGYLYFLDAAGLLRQRVKTLDQQLTAPVVKGDQVVLVTLAGRIQSYSSDGTLTVDADAGYGALTAPIVLDDGHLLYGASGPYLAEVGYNGNKTDFVLTSVTGDIVDIPTLLKDGTVSATETGGKVWFFPPSGLSGLTFQAESDTNLSSAVEIEDGVVAVVGKKAVYVLNSANAQIMNKIEIPVAGQFSAASSQPVVTADGTLVFAAADGVNSKIFFMKQGQTN